MHSHILFDVDDGPKTIEETLCLFEQQFWGISTIVSTSHALHPLYNVPFDVVNEQIVQLQMAIDQRNMPLKLYTGQEVRLAGNILELYEKTITYISKFQLFAVGTSL